MLAVERYTEWSDRLKEKNRPLIRDGMNWSGAYILSYFFAKDVPSVLVGIFVGFAPALLSWIAFNAKKAGEKQHSSPFES